MASQPVHWQDKHALDIKQKNEVIHGYTSDILAVIKQMAISLEGRGEIEVKTETYSIRMKA